MNVTLQLAQALANGTGANHPRKGMNGNHSFGTKYECPNPLQLMPEAFVELLHVQDASASYAKARDEVGDQIELLAAHLVATFGNENVATGLATFIDDKSGKYDNIFCYDKNVPLAKGNGQDLGDAIRKLETVSNYDANESGMKAIAMSFNDFKWGEEAPSGMPLLRFITTATVITSITNSDNIGKVMESETVGHVAHLYNYPKSVIMPTYDSCHDSATEDSSYLPSMKYILQQAQEKHVRMVFMTSGKPGRDKENHLTTRDELNEWYENIAQEFRDSDVPASYTASGKLSDFAHDMMLAITTSACTEPPTVYTVGDGITAVVSHNFKKVKHKPLVQPAAKTHHHTKKSAKTKPPKLAKSLKSTKTTAATEAPTPAKPLDASETTTTTKAIASHEGAAGGDGGAETEDDSSSGAGIAIIGAAAGGAVIIAASGAALMNLYGTEEALELVDGGGISDAAAAATEMEAFVDLADNMML